MSGEHLEEMPLNCPMEHVYDLVPAPVEELEPLARRLIEADPVREAQAFPRGTLLPDGRLDLCKQSLGVGGSKVVLEAVRRSRHVTNLLLGTNGIGDEGAVDVATLAQDHPTLQTLYLGCNRIHTHGAQALASALESNPRITGLWLKRNALGAGGVQAIAAMLASNTTLTTLDLVTTRMELSGFHALMDVLTQTNRTVKYLFLSANGFGPAQASRLAELLAVNSTLRGLYLGLNAFGDTGAEILARGLIQNQNLHDLELASCGIGDPGATALRDAATRHPALTRLNVDRARATRAVNAQPNKISKALRKEIREIIAMRAPNGISTPPEIAGIRSVYR